MSKSFWWSDFATIIGPGFAKLRAAQLHRAGLRKDAWEGDGFISAESARGKFGLKKTEYNSRKFAIRTLTRAWAGLLTGIIPRADPQEWIGVFEDNPSSLPSVVFTTGFIPNLIIGALRRNVCSLHSSTCSKCSRQRAVLSNCTLGGGRGAILKVSMYLEDFAMFTSLRSTRGSKKTKLQL